MLSDDFSAARRRLDPIGCTPLLINRLSSLELVTVNGSSAGLKVTVSVVASSFIRVLVVKVRIALVD